ncbi:hypothetical protein IQ270_20150 [Microcoleus sp. LEGE 07076]|uniref:hypothetical protein n=1 Tax=Microcoleus sp. LEGE 07076 TaxID=915322 RepID=UPI00188156ED|nr:hypothetical protein [Microcoleus sp. LEGE 07076]MBE9186905.1 hypothetical protein [Microcoleus sp. LEGE 07076]
MSSIPIAASAVDCAGATGFDITCSGGEFSAAGIISIAPELAGDRANKLPNKAIKKMVKLLVTTAVAGIILNIAIARLGFAALVRPVADMNQTVVALETMLSATQKPAAIDYSRLGISGVRLGISVAEAKRKLGKPQRDETKSAESAIGGKIRTLTYSGLTVAASEDKVYLISTTNPKLATIDGVKVGDHSQKVVKTYGYGWQSVHGGATRLTYSNDQKASNLVLEIKGDRVQKMIVGTQLN